LLPALAFLSCSEDSMDPQSPEEQITGTTEEVVANANVEVAYPNEIGKVSEVYYAGQKMAVEEIDGEYIYEGDIKLSPEYLSSGYIELVYEKGQAPTDKSVG